MLASRSAARRGMLTSAGVVFEVVKPNVDEDMVKASAGTARAIADHLATLKALTPPSFLAAPQDPPPIVDRGQFVIGSDQTLELDGELFSKADSLEALRSNLMCLRGKTHVLHSAVVVARHSEVVWSHTETARLTMRAFSDPFLDNYLTRHGDEVRSSLGGYWFEAQGVQLFDAIEGDYFAILGMPLLPLLDFLRSVGAMPK